MKDITAEIITIGDEILIGQITDTNSQWISSELDLLGIKTHKKTSIRDEEQAILNELEEAFKRSDLIIVTGGLGPTKDDITKKTLAKFFGVKLKRDQEVLDHVRSLFEKRGRQMNKNNIGQADIPENCQVLKNNWGTAPGMLFRQGGSILVSMPGVPVEMKNLMKNEVFPIVVQEFETPIIKHRVVKTMGIGESDLMSVIGNWENKLPEHIKLAYLPRLGQVRLRLSGKGNNADHLNKDLDLQVEELLKLIPKYFYAYGEVEFEDAVAQLLKEKNISVSTAESCTGGNIAKRLTSFGGSSQFFKGGIIAYSNEIKINELNVESADINSKGAVSEEVVMQMAENIRLKFKTDIGLSSSGIAGPDGGTPEKPVGTIWIALSDSKGTISKKLTLGSNRKMNIELTTLNILNLLRGRIQGWI
jgi:nicotinamide-nucleotide amidase